MTRALSAEIRIGRRSNRRRNPDSTALVEHRVVDVVLAVPQHFVAPVWRRRLHLRALSRWRVRVANGQLHPCRFVVSRIEDWNETLTELHRTIDETVRIDGRIAPIS